jgi:hypothetical protein
LLIQSGSSAGWATMMNFSGDQPHWGWSTYADPPLIEDWPLATSNPLYFLVRAVAGESEFLFARKRSCSWYYDAIFQFCLQPAGC